MVKSLFDITATMGPSCKDEKVIKYLILNGVTSFRFPFSKETPQWQILQAKKVREIANKLNKNIELIMDIPGSQTRTLNETLIELFREETILLYYGNEPENNKFKSIKLSDKKIIKNATIDNIIYFGDGEISSKIDKIEEDYIVVTTLNSGFLHQKRGCTLEKNKNSNSALTKIDEEYLIYNNDFLFDRILVSFVQNKFDIIKVKEFLGGYIEQNNLPKISAKIETVESLNNIDEIIEVSDYILVARGDLILQGGIVNFYESQIEIIEKCIHNNKPVQVGTQLLEDLSCKGIINRAEISDVSNLISIGISGILLSSETTIGKELELTINILNKLIRKYQNA